ncbi:MAG: hypothetical protein J5819_04520, partial [Eubacterium sp.]|nr:hypothetical protein [Eubacterium sp.]
SSRTARFSTSSRHQPKAANGRTRSEIRKQKYLDRFEHYKGNILVIGINYDKDVSNTSPEFKHHSCRIEKA